MEGLRPREHGAPGHQDYKHKKDIPLVVQVQNPLGGNNRIRRNGNVDLQDTTPAKWLRRTTPIGEPHRD
eukprot:4055866-Prorocentrum_lima.AAC.1